MRPTWILSAPEGPHVGPMNLAIRVYLINWSMRSFSGLKTYGGAQSCTLIDNAFCKLSADLTDLKAGIILSDISDHYPYFVSVRGKNRSNVEKKIKLVKKETHTHAAYDGFLNDLISSNVTLSLNQDPYADPNENCELLHNHVTTLENKHIPTKYVKFKKYRHKGSQWITRGVMPSIRYKDRLYRDLKRTNPNSPMYVELKTKLHVYNKLLKKNIREAKKNYYENQFQSYKSDIRKTWGIISEILSKKHRNKSSIKSIVINGKTIKDNQQITEKFNDFFLNIGTNLAASLEKNTSKTHRSYLNSNILTSFGFSLVDEDHIDKIMKSLKNKTSSGHDGISVKLLKYLSPALLKPLTLIINQSLITGLFPEKLKIAKVQPLFKKGDKKQNYRSISLLTSISKVFEKVVFLQLTNDNGLFYDGQYGFREKPLYWNGDSGTTRPYNFRTGQ